MAFQITITADAASQLEALSAREQRMLKTAIAAKLSTQPTTPTRAIKRLRPNPLAQFELRAGNLRVLYNVEGSEVVLLVIGKKVGNALIVKGEEFHGHQNNPTEPPRSGSAGNA